MRMRALLSNLYAVLRANWLFVAIIMVFIFCSFWLIGHSFIKVVLDGKPASYGLIQQAQGNTSFTTNEKSTNYKKLVSNGDYLALVARGESSYFSATKTKGLLRTTTVHASLRPESFREFIGNNPGPCGYYTGVLLYTYSCDNSYDSLRVHQPASSDTPTTVAEPPRGAFHTMNGVVRLQNQDWIVVTDSDIEDGGSTKLYPLRPDFILGSGIALKNLPKNTDYTVKPYMNGIVVYSADFKDVYYYKDVLSKPEVIKFNQPEDKNLVAQSISVQGNRLALTYMDAVSKKSGDLDGLSISGGKSFVQVYDSKSKDIRGFELSSNFTKIFLCGANNVCALNGRTLEIYDEIDDKLVKSVAIPGVQAADSMGETLIFATREYIMGYNIGGNSGFIQYSLAGYEFCGFIQVTSSGYSICISDVRDNRYALYINPSIANKDSIDKKLLSLQTNNPNVQELSPYKKMIYISPRLGSVSYNPEVGGYTYDKLWVSKVSASIKKSIDELTLEGQGYTFINPYANY